MNEWEIAAVVLMGAAVPCLGVCILAGAIDALVAYEQIGVARRAVDIG